MDLWLMASPHNVPHRTETCHKRQPRAQDTRDCGGGEGGRGRRRRSGTQVMVAPHHSPLSLVQQTTPLTLVALLAAASPSAGHHIRPAHREERRLVHVQIMRSVQLHDLWV